MRAVTSLLFRLIATILIVGFCWMVSGVLFAATNAPDTVLFLGGVIGMVSVSMLSMYALVLIWRAPIRALLTKGKECIAQATKPF